MKHVLAFAALAAAALGALAQEAGALNPDRNLEAARSYGAFAPTDRRKAPVPGDEAVRAEPVQGRVNGSASRDWAMRHVA